MSHLDSQFIAARLSGGLLRFRFGVTQAAAAIEGALPVAC